MIEDLSKVCSLTLPLAATIELVYNIFSQDVKDALIDLN